jgi:hypothetical protein
MPKYALFLVEESFILPKVWLSNFWKPLVEQAFLQRRCQHISLSVMWPGRAFLLQLTDSHFLISLFFTELGNPSLLKMNHQGLFMCHFEDCKR